MLPPPNFTISRDVSVRCGAKMALPLSFLTPEKITVELARATRHFTILSKRRGTTLGNFNFTIVGDRSAMTVELT